MEHMEPDGAHGAIWHHAGTSVQQTTQPADKPHQQQQKGMMRQKEAADATTVSPRREQAESPTALTRQLPRPTPIHPWLHQLATTTTVPSPHPLLTVGVGQQYQLIQQDDSQQRMNIVMPLPLLAALVTQQQQQQRYQNSLVETSLESSLLAIAAEQSLERFFKNA
jgi:transcription elongation GreA/GreB family factor